MVSMHSLKLGSPSRRRHQTPKPDTKKYVAVHIAARHLSLAAVTRRISVSCIGAYGAKQYVCYSASHSGVGPVAVSTSLSRCASSALAGSR